MLFLNSLDFLRKCRELSDWYGPAFYFVANPLMLPFPTCKIYEEFKLAQKIQDHLLSQPYGRIGLMNPEEYKHWTHVQYMNDFRRKLAMLSTDWSFNWPTIPIVREDDENQRLFTIFLVLFILTHESIEKSFKWERK